jgi:predicted AlkP superfamily phosphohydrolase/phosphomutase
MKVLILGLDGVPRRLLEELGAGGVMPFLGGLIRQGMLRDLAASIPEISSVSWSSFMTGKNPGEHGIFGFTDLVPPTRKIRFPRFSDLAVPTFWDRLGLRGLRSVVINQPSTYPARALPGAMVSGFVALDLDRAVYPAKHLRKLSAMGYATDVDMQKGREDKEGLLKDLSACLAVHEKAAWYFWDAEKWDIFELVVTGTDRLQHVLWDAVEEKGHPLHQRALDYYHEVDALAERFVSRFRDAHPAGALYILSDHGFTRCRKEVRLNAWLEENGYLSYKDDQRTSPESLAPGTRAFALDPGRIYLCGPDPERSREEISARLARLEHEGRPVMRAVHRREDIYRGPQAARGPDLVAQGNDGFDLKGTFKAREVFAEPSLTGMHDPEAFLLTDQRLPGKLNIEDIAATIEAHHD